LKLRKCNLWWTVLRRVFMNLIMNPHFVIVLIFRTQFNWLYSYRHISIIHYVVLCLWYYLWIIKHAIVMTMLRFILKLLCILSKWYIILCFKFFILPSWCELSWLNELLLFKHWFKAFLTSIEIWWVSIIDHSAWVEPWGFRSWYFVCLFNVLLHYNFNISN
jgi:hypothetical protein